MDVKADLKKDYNAASSTYETDHGHTGDEAMDLYIADLRDALGEAEGRSALDVGAGTGILTSVLLRSGYRVRGVDFAEDMLAIARRKLPSVEFDLVSDIERSPDTYSAGAFDLIISRQVVGHFTDPIGTFRDWSRWLKSSGRIAVIDGLWDRSDWTNQWRKYPDHLPLACTQTWAPAAYMLEQAGLVVTRREWLVRVNEYEARRAAETGKAAVVRYIVVGQRQDAEPGPVPDGFN